MAELAAEAARLLRMREKDILSLRLLRRSVDAREEVRLVYTVEVAVKEESAILRRARSRKISRAAQAPAYTPPSPLPAPAVPPVVVGAGPAGLFAALGLALVIFTLFVLSDNDRFQGTAVAREGLWEQLCLAAMYVPLLLDAIVHLISAP